MKWLTPGLTVTISPELGLQMDDGAVVIKLWLSKDAPTADAVKTLHRLLRRHLPSPYEGAKLRYPTSVASNCTSQDAGR